MRRVSLADLGLFVKDCRAGSEAMKGLNLSDKHGLTIVQFSRS